MHASKLKSIFLLFITLVSIVATSFPSVNSEETELILSVQTDKPFYYFDQVVLISGFVRNLNGTPIADVRIGIEVKDPKDNTIFLDITYSTFDGTYQDSFRLPSIGTVGRYNVYVTAYKPGFQSASEQTSFYVSIEEIGDTTISILSHNASLENSLVNAALNVTMLSNTLTSTVVTNRLICVNPNGTIVYDNFQGIGTTTDYKLTTIQNNSISTINYQFSLPSPKIGYYTCFFGVYDGYGLNLYDSTPWIPAFLYTAPPIYTQDLGLLSAESSLSTTPSVTMNRYDTAKFSLTLLQPVQSISIDLTASLSSKFIITLEKGDLIAQSMLHVTFSWKIYNVPEGIYNLTITALSDIALLSELLIQSGPEITTSILISSVKATSQQATPCGKMNYHVIVEWNITSIDSLIISAKLQGEIEDAIEYDLEPLHGNQKDFYLTVEAPSEIGNYTVEFNATLRQSALSSLKSVPLLVRYGQYNITISPEIVYYKMPPWWQWWDRKPIPVNDPTQLTALDVTDIKISWIDEFDGETPTKATISFQAHNKPHGGILESLKFGEGVHYEVHIKFGSEEYTLAYLVAGDTKTVYAYNVPIINGELSFTISYHIWWLGEIFEVASSILKPAVSFLIQGVDLGLAHLAIDLSKLVALYLLQIWLEQDYGYLAYQDIESYLMKLGVTVTSNLLAVADKAMEHTQNPFFALFRALIYAKMSGKIDLVKFATAIFKLIVYVSGNALPKIVERIQVAAILAFKKIGITLAKNINNYLDAKKFLWKIDILLSVVEMCFTIARLLGAPSEEGKIVNKAGVDLGPPATVDPTISLSYNGPTSNTNLTYFGDMYDIAINITRSQAQITFKVDPNLTSTYLSILSDDIYRRDLLANMGFNATRTNLQWINGSNIFTIYGNGTIQPGLQKLNIRLNSTWITASQNISVYASKNVTTALLNSTLVYPFGKNLNYLIQVVLPPGSTDIQVLSGGSYTIERNIITWSSPVDWISIKFTPPSWTTTYTASEEYPIVDFAVYTGKLYATSDNTLYVYNGTSWNNIDAPTYVLSLEPYEDHLIVGGKDGLYSYDGVTFNLILPTPGYIKVLGVYNNNLYAGTQLAKPPTLYYCNGSVENPSDWNIDTAFSLMLNFSGPFGSIDSFTVYDNEMYVGSGGTVYCFNGTDWSIATSYDDVYAFLDMEVYNDKLYLATRDQAWRKPYYQGGTGFSGRAIEFDGSNWTTVLDHDYWIYSLETYHGRLYAGTANKIFEYNMTDWNISFNSSNDLAQYAISFEVYNDTLYVGMGNGYIYQYHDPTSLVTIHVQDSNGDPIALADIVVEDIYGAEVARGDTDQEGNFYPCLPAGEGYGAAATSPSGNTGYSDLFDVPRTDPVLIIIDESSGENSSTATTKNQIDMRVTEIPEFPATTILPLIMLLSIIAVVFAKKKN